MIKNHENTRPNICVITSPRPKASINPLSHIMDIMCSLSDQTYLITGNEGKQVYENNMKIKCYCIKDETKETVMCKVINYINLQLKISYKIVKWSQKVDIWIFYMGEGLFLPALTIKILKKPLILSLAASSPKIIDSNIKVPFIYKILKYLEILNYTICDIIVLYSPNIIKEWNLEKYRKKVRIGHEHFLDFNRFKLEKKYSKRHFFVGYIGRLSNEKGVLNLVQAIPNILINYPNLTFIIGGAGNLENSIESYIATKQLNKQVKFIRWVPNDELPNYLNDLKILVLPSYTEGLPNIILEAMSCGAIVLATPVGAIPDYIIDGETGFIMNNNSQECIEKNILRVVDHPNLEQIIVNAKLLVENEFTFDIAMNKYRKILFNSELR